MSAKIFVGSGVDDGFVGTVHEFSGVGRGMLVSPGKHRVRIALPGYQAFETEVNLLPHQKIAIKTNLAPGSITQASPSIKKDSSLDCLGPQVLQVLEPLFPNTCINH